MFRSRIAPHTANATNKTTPVTPTRYRRKDKKALAIIMNIKHRRIATIATTKPTPRAINSTISPTRTMKVCGDMRYNDRGGLKFKLLTILR